MNGAMYPMKRLGVAVAILAGTTGAFAQADTTPGVVLRLSYENRSIGKDGVTRDSRHADRMVRRANVVWLERELPAALRESDGHGHHEPGPHAGHAHEDAQGAPLLVRRDPATGRIGVQSVLHPQRRVIDVELAHHANVGYGGSWQAAYWLIDPAVLPRMEKVGGVVGGVQRYRLRKGEKTTRVDWNVAGQYAALIEQKDAHGLSVQRMTATPLPAPKVMPWDQLGGYGRGDYSDLLD